jgi:short-subunit dehydrogenase
MNEGETMRELAGRTALITGASRGLGLYIARALAAEKMNLVLAARSREGLEAIADEVREAGGRAIAVPTDVTDRGALEALVAAAEGEFGEVDVLVNNAGTLVSYPFEMLGIEDMERAIRLNLISAMILTRLVLPGMLKRGRGHIVNMSSTAGKWGPPFDEVYGVTKAGLIRFTESLRTEYHGTGVSASVLCPGYVEEAGMYHDARQIGGAAAPAWVGRTTPDKVATATLKAIKRNIPEIVVNTPPSHALSILTAISPGFVQWMLRRFNAWAPFYYGAKANVKAGGQLTGLRGR